MAEFNTVVPTGYDALNIIFGENVRDLDGNLVDIHRGMKLGKQYVFAAPKGAGKSTLIADIAAFGKHIDFPLWKVIVVDTDEAEWDTHRISKITDLTPEESDDLFDIIHENTLERITKEILARHNEYMAKKFKPVDITDLYTGKKKKMMPYVVLIIDTVSHISLENYDIEGKSGVIAKEAYMQMYQGLGSWAKNIRKYFDGNVIIMWSTHLKENQPKMGQTVAEKTYKAMTNTKTDALPQTLRNTASFVLWMFPKDGGNLESSKHPINEYSMNDIKSGSVFEVDTLVAKSRASVDGRTEFVFMFIDGKFDKNSSLLVTAYKNDVFRKESGTYPSGTETSIFTEGIEKEIMGRQKKQKLSLEGYDRPTNIVEARLLMNYVGEDPTILDYQMKFLVALLNGLENKLYYELEVNNITAKDIYNNKRRLSQIFVAQRQIQRNEKIDVGEKIELPEIKELQHELEGESDE